MRISLYPVAVVTVFPEHHRNRSHRHGARPQRRQGVVARQLCRQVRRRRASLRNGAWPIVITNVVTLALSVLVLLLKHRYRTRNDDGDD